MGTYKDGISDDVECTECPDYSTTSGTGSASPDACACNSNFIKVEGECVCNVGYELSESENCESILFFSNKK